MQWSWRIGSVRGIEVRVHATLALLVGWLVLARWLGGSPAGALASLAVVLGVLGSIVLHELGHALVAQRLGVRVRDITLYPIGGVARLERIPERPAHELAIAAAGPLVSAVLGVALLAAGLGMGAAAWISPELLLRGGAPLLLELGWINLGLAVFNLMPAFPMDGGRMLRALLASGSDYVVATERAMQVGRASAVLLGIAGVMLSAPTLVFVAVFVWIAGAAEASAVEARAIFRRLPARAAMMTDVRTLGTDVTLAEAARALLAGSQSAFPVVEDGVVVGVLTTNEILRGLASRGAEDRVENLMDRRLALADPDERLDVVLERAAALERDTVIVIRDGRLVGMITPENLAELVFVERAIGAAGPRTSTGHEPPHGTTPA